MGEMRDMKCRIEKVEDETAVNENEINELVDENEELKYCWRVRRGWCALVRE